MDRMVTSVIDGVEYTLNFSMEVMFDMTDKFGNLREALDAISADNKEAFEAVRWLFVKMANDGELCRREAGYDHRPMIREEDISLRTTPWKYVLMKSAVVAAINQGYFRESADENQEVDVGLEELRAKKAKAGE